MKELLSLLLLCLIIASCGSSSGGGDASSDKPATLSGTLDTSFSEDGIVTHNNAAGGNSTDKGNALAVDADGNIYVAGQSRGSNYDMTLWKYKLDGTLDYSFNGTGVVTNNNAAGGDGDDSGNAVTLDSDGNIYVTGYSDNPDNEEMVLWKYKPNGLVDITFSEDGIVTHNNAAGGDGGDVGLAIALDTNNDIYIAGYSFGSAATDMALWKYKSDGTLDTTFNGTGFVTHNNAAGGNNLDRGFSMVLDAYGNIYVAGDSVNGSNSDMALWKFRPDGTLDTAFNGTGFVTHNNAAGGNGIDRGNSIALDINGNIYVTGYSPNASDYDMALWKYKPDGTLDTSFNGVGFVTHNNTAGGSGDDSGESVTLDADGNIYVTGYSSNASDYDMALWKYKPDGTLDTSFNGTGYIIYDGERGNDFGLALVNDIYGYIYIAGYSQTLTGLDMALWKFE